MDKVSKFLLLIARKERERLIPVMRDITEGVILHLNCKKLKGKDNDYRVRVGQVRIIFRKIDNQNVIIYVGFRDDNTY